MLSKSKYNKSYPAIFTKADLVQAMQQHTPYHIDPFFLFLFFFFSFVKKHFMISTVR